MIRKWRDIHHKWVGQIPKSPADKLLSQPAKGQVGWTPFPLGAGWMTKSKCLDTDRVGFWYLVKFIAVVLISPNGQEGQT